MAQTDDAEKAKEARTEARATIELRVKVVASAIGVVGVVISILGLLYGQGFLRQPDKPLPSSPTVPTEPALSSKPQLKEPPPSPVAVPLPAAPPAATTLVIDSRPPGAQAYLDWRLLGPTPVHAERSSLRGLLVVVQRGYQAATLQLDHPTAVAPITLTPEAPGSTSMLILVDPQPSSPEALSSLRHQLTEKGIGVVGAAETDDFRRELRRAGGLSNIALREWARATFGAEIVVLAKIQTQRRDLGDQDSGYRGIRDAARGVSRTELRIELQAFRLKSGEPFTALSTTGVGLGLDPDQALSRALAEAVEKCASTLAERLRG